MLELISKYATNVEKIALCRSTQAKESLNQGIACKNPKSRHYARSESLAFRVAASVSQKNIGLEYSSNIFKKMGYQQSEASLFYKLRKDQNRETR